jgi:hypothetical protein
MYSRQWLVTLIVFGLTLSNAPAAEPAPVPADESANFALAKQEAAKRDAARRTFEGYWKDRYWRDVEIPYRWSRRWVEAECKLSAKQVDQVAAYQQHLDRMKELGQITRQQFQDGRLVKVDEIDATEYYVAEAAEWLAQAKGRADGAVSRR